jgi:hypothetical protein
VSEVLFVSSFPSSLLVLVLNSGFVPNHHC